jgi:spermidine/putrescine transport system ATP-binding protein
MKQSSEVQVKSRDTALGHGVSLGDVTMRFGEFVAVDDVSVDIAPGEFFSFLGPSGCGKTTILRLISGFIEPTAGSIRIGGRDMAGIGPNKRPTALIFQNLALFPLMPVWENVAFGLEARGVPKPERRRRAEQLLELVALGGSGDKRVNELSGGQRQRVAIARALAVEPKVMLLDEPLSALDLKLRQHMRAELRAIQRRTGVTFIYITHDQSEALAMSDRVAVMSQGRIEQVDVPDAIYNAPQTAFVAGFVGEINRFTGHVVAADAGHAVVETDVGRLRGVNRQGLRPGARASVFIRPERMRADEAATADENSFPAVLNRIGFEGNVVNLFLRTNTGREIIAQRHNSGDLSGLSSGAWMTLCFTPDSAAVLSLSGSRSEATA